MAEPAGQQTTPGRYRWVKVFLWILLLSLLALRFLHPAADFPLNSRWIDDAGRYTDEGWYSAGAINHVLHRVWILPGDFNPVVDLPVWSVALNSWFHLAGFGMAPARELDILCSCLVVLLAGLWMARYEPSLALPAAVLVASSPILFFFGRLALLETPMLVFVLPAMILLSKLPAGTQGYLRVLLAGALLAAAILTKTVALFLVPAALSLILIGHKKNRSVAALAAAFCAVIAAVCAAYWFFAIAPHIADHRALMKENGFDLGFHPIEKLARVFYRGTTWTDSILFPLALLSVLAAFSTVPALRRHPLAVCSWLWCMGYAVFVVGHVSADPRYFTVFAIPAIFLSLLLAKSLHEQRSRLFAVTAALIALSALWNTAYVVWRQSRPQYTYRTAGLAIAQTLKNYPQSSPLLIGHGIGGISLYTGLPVLNEIGSYPLDKKLDIYKPGWILIWEDGKELLSAEPITRRYLIVPRGSFDALDQSSRHRLLLYQLVPRIQPSESFRPAVSSPSQPATLQ